MSSKPHTTVVIALGSNVRQEINIDKAMYLLRSNFESVSFSDPMWTEPIGLEGSDKFLNMVAVGRTTYRKERVVEALKHIELRCGRRRGNSNRGNIALDLDLLRYGDEICHPDDWGRDYIKELMKQQQSFIDFWDSYDKTEHQEEQNQEEGKTKNPNAELD